MGSFTSSPKIGHNDCQDNDMIPIERDANSTKSLLEKCHRELQHFPPLLPRTFCSLRRETDDLSPNTFRIMQWNVLSQALGVCNDNFTTCPRQALEWKFRRFRMLEEMLVHSPDILCLQEVDHYSFLENALGSIGFQGMFLPKPDSPCIYLQGNNGPDGCAIFFNRSKFEMVRMETRILEVWHTVQSNQVALLVILRFLTSGDEICVVTTHLKAKCGAFLATLRNEQGKDLLEFVRTHCGGRPLVLSGDFNAEPSEPVYSTVLSDENLALASTYYNLNQSEPRFTTWKIRQDGEVCHTIDYIFYSDSKFWVNRLLQFPEENEMGAGRVPSLCYPSDHFSLVADLSLKTPCRVESQTPATAFDVKLS